MSSAERPIPCLIGATGVGKTAVGIVVARRLCAEVICCDALTVYRGLSILTAKPSPPPDAPHHLVDVCSPDETYSAARFLDDADRLVDEIRGRGREALIVGGTALYLKAFAKGIGPRVGRDEALRARLEALAASEGPQALWDLLESQDPVRAGELHRNDTRRLVRALEIVAASGRPASDLRREWTAPDRRPLSIVGLRRGAADLEARIRLRAAGMLAEGVAEEVERLATAVPPPSRELRQALGLGDVEAYLAGRLSREACIDRLALATRQFARRQATFFAQFDAATWLDVAPDEPSTETAARVVAVYARGTSA